jgi:alpha-mannosidase
VNDHRTTIEDRLERLLHERIRPAVHARSAPLDVRRWDVPGEPVAVTEALGATYRAATAGETWGPPWSTTWFRVRGEVPRDWRGRTVEIVIDLGFATDRPGFSAEALVHTADGTPVKGLSPLNMWVPVAAPAAGGESLDLFVEAAANPLILGTRETDLGDLTTAGEQPAYALGDVRLVLLDEGVRHLTHDLEVLQQLMGQLPIDDGRRWEILYAVERALDVLDPHDVGATAGASRAELTRVLTRPVHASAHRVCAVGHAHIDSAWLWPLRESVRKVARTTANVLTLMDDDSGHALVVGADIPDAVREGYRINLPERHADGATTVPPLVTASDGVVVEAVKLADDRSGDLVVRCYEAHGARRRGEVSVPIDVVSATVTDLLERPVDDGTPLAVEHGVVHIDLRPFEVVTLRFARA